MNKDILVHLFHIIIVGSLFLYVGITRNNMPTIMYSVLFYLGIIVILYHIYKAYNYLKLGKGIWVNLIHIFIVGPILIYIGYKGLKTARLFYEIVLMLAFASIGYHGYYLVQALQK